MIINTGFRIMRKKLVYLAPAVFLILASIFVIGNPDNSGAASAEGQFIPFFSQGQSAYNPQDQAKSQQLAVQDFMGQALIQAMSRYLNPSQMGTQFPEIQKKILSQPSKYVDSYQVFSETQNGGLYKVVGQVTIAMDVLKKDMESQGFPLANAAAEEVEAPSSAPSDSDSEDADDTEEPAGTAQTGRSPTPVAPQEPRAATSRGLSVTKMEVLWVVPEKWEQEWVLPTDKRDIRSLFTQSIARELAGYDYSLQFPQPGSVKMDITGNIPPSQVISLAQGLGIQAVVLGTASFKQERGSKIAKLEANLRVIRTGPDKSGGEIRQDQSMEELSNQEGAAELASRIAPRLNTLLGGAGEAKPKASLPDSAPEKQGSASASGTDRSEEEWTIHLPAAQYSYWREVERILREQFKNMHVNGLEMGTKDGVVRLSGLDGSFISKMNGTSLPSGTLIVIDSYSAETRIIKVSFTPQGKVQGSPKQ
jgi:hypothetical protein